MGRFKDELPALRQQLVIQGGPLAMIGFVSSTTTGKLECEPHCVSHM